MRSICQLAPLLLCAFFGFSMVVNAAPETLLCDSNTVATGTVLATALAGSYLATECTFNGEVRISSNGILTGPDSVDVLVKDSTINPSSALQVIGPSAVLSVTRCPFRMTVRGNVFDQGTFHFIGSLPPNSFIIFEANTMNAVGTPSNTANGILRLIHFLSLDSDNAIIVNENSNITIDSNTISAETSLNVFAIAMSPVIVGQGGFVKVQENSISLNLLASFQQSPIGLDVSAVTFSDNGASFAVDDNVITIRGGNAIPFAVQVAGGFQSTRADISDTLVSYSGNRIYFQVLGGHEGTFRCLNPSRFNRFVVERNDISINFDGQMVAISGFELPPSSQFLIRGNTFTRRGGAVIMFPLIHLHDSQGNNKRVIISNGASIVVTCNSFFASGIASSAQIVAIKPHDVPLLPLPSNPSPFFYGKNVFSWSSAAPASVLFSEREAMVAVEVDENCLSTTSPPHYVPSTLAPTTHSSTPLPTSLVGEDICPSGTLPNDFNIQIVPGQTYIATDCTLMNSQFSIQWVPNTPFSTLSVKNSVVQHALWLSLLQEWEANSMGPFYITIENNIFEHNAGFFTRNAMPPNSVLTFQNNQMSGLSSTDTFGAQLRMSIGIQGLVFLSDSIFNIINNTLTASEDNAAYLQFVYMNDVTVKGKGTMNILGNTMSLYETIHGSFIQHRGVCRMYGAFGLHIDSNTFSGSTRHHLPILQTETISSPSGQRNNLLSITNNKVDLYVEDADSSVVSLGSFSNMDLALNGNTISSNGNLFLHGYAGTFAPGHYASIIGNRYDAPIAITGQYSLIQFSGYQFVKDAVLTVARNTVTAPSVISTPQFVSMNNFDYRPSSTIKHCGNKLPWTDSSASADQLFPYSINAIGLVSYATDICGDNIMTTIVPTPIPTTLTTGFKEKSTTPSTNINEITNPAANGPLAKAADVENKTLLVVAIIVPVVGFLALAAGAVFGVLHYKRRESTRIAGRASTSDHVNGTTTVVVFTEAPMKLDWTEPVAVEGSVPTEVRGPDHDDIFVHHLSTI